MKYSFIIPVYNRPDEVRELLESMERQTLKDFEIIVVEDGSSVPCNDVVSSFKDRVNVHYFFKENTGPGSTRNYGASKCNGEYLIILDSDCILPDTYLEMVDKELKERPCDAFGGPDRAHSSFSNVQKAINYAMTSFFTTGGIRGGKKQMEKFHPRSFNMCVRREVYQALGGFSKMRFGEDIDFSIRIFKGGYRCLLFPEAWVWHKRRTDFKKFFRQVYNSGIARINLYKRHPESLKTVHLLPTLFTLGTLALLVLVLSPLGIYSLLPLLLFSLIIFIDSTMRNKSAIVGIISVGAAFVQLLGYGCGFIVAFIRRCILRRDEFSAFSKNFYK